MDRDPGSVLDIVRACRRLKHFVVGRSREDPDRDEPPSSASAAGPMLFFPRAAAAGGGACRSQATTVLDVGGCCLARISER
jgi:hypothetical protein